MKTRAIVLLSLIGAAASTSLADFVTVDLSSNINSDLRTYTNGFNYPVGGQTLDFGGVPMQLGLYTDPTVGIPNEDSLGVVQIPTDETPVSYSFSVNIPGAMRLYTLINSEFGVENADNGSVEVFGLNGSYAKLELIQGDNIRDHYQGFYQNDITDPTVFSTYYPGDLRLDRQVLELPAEFATDTVTELRFSGTGSVFNGGAAFLAGATFEQVPTPGATALALTGGIMLMWRRRR